jgi:FKBP-type peptidyl-prolyl cis-trans isomerase
MFVLIVHDAVVSFRQEDLKLGKADAPAAAKGCTVTMKYAGTLLSGEKFDAASKFSFTLGAGEVIKGWEKGVPGMRVGGRRKLTIPPKVNLTYL